MKKVIVFDMDGVLIDVSSSYRDVSRRTAYIFLKDCIGGEALPDPLFSLEELAAVKQSGGLNNDWDLTFRVISLLLSRADVSEGPRERWDVSPLAGFLARSAKPLSSLMAEGEISSASDIYFRGDVGSGNIIKQIFQEIYLGGGLYRETYGIGPEFYDGEGYILREKLLVPVPVLNELAEENILAVATGRPEREALYPLEKNDLDMFSDLISLDDCLAAEEEVLKQTGKKVSFSKPDPFMLDRIGKKYSSSESFIYAGDTGDDMIAAKNSSFPFKAAGIIYSAPSQKKAMERLTECGADIIIASPFELLKLK